MPLLIFLHGIGERGTDLNKVMKYGPLRQLQDGIDIGPAKDWIIVHPLNQSGEWTIEEIDDVINYSIDNYSVDQDRILLMGVSHGGTGVWRYAQSAVHVQRLAAIVPICGGNNDPSKANVLVDDGIAGWAAHADNDPIVPYNTTKRMVDSVNDLAQNSQILFSQYGMFGHSAWVYFLRPEYGVYQWLKYQSKSNKHNSVPSEIIILHSGQQLIIKSL